MNINPEVLTRTIDEALSLSNPDLVRENANMDGTSPLGQLMSVASSVTKLASRSIYSPEVNAAIDDDLIYAHDADYTLTGTLTCAQIPLDELLAKGFHTDHGYTRPAQTIQSAAALEAVILQSSQNVFHGGQSILNHDFDLAPYVKKTYDRHRHELTMLFASVGLTLEESDLHEKAMAATDRDTYQAMEALLHNLNSMHSRGGGSVVFSSLNYGLDTTVWGRLVTKNTLLALEAGLGDGETPIFPIHVFRCHSEVNLEPGTINHDLFELATRVTAKRLFPNFLHMETSFNRQGFQMDDPSTHVGTMGCRTRVYADRFGPSTSKARGNISFTTLNLPLLAHRAQGDPDRFRAEVDAAMSLARQQLLERFEYQASRTASTFKFWNRNGVWKGADRLGPDDEVRDVIKHGTLSIGFIGAAEAMTLLFGAHHGESDEVDRFLYSVVSSMRESCDLFSDLHDLNFSLFATPAESLCRTITRKNRARLGIIPGVTDRDYTTNSCHVPVWHPIGALSKIAIEGKYHKLLNAGQIMYVETDGRIHQNPQAIADLVRMALVSDVGYFAVNHPVDHCGTCGHHGSIENACPACGESDEANIARIARITGYLVGETKRWNSGKQAELRDRVDHGGVL